jgi:hypothetical protein
MSNLSGVFLLFLSATVQAQFREVPEANINHFHLTKLMAALVGLKKTTKPEEQE